MENKLKTLVLENGVCVKKKNYCEENLTKCIMGMSTLYSQFLL